MTAAPRDPTRAITVRFGRRLARVSPAELAAQTGMTVDDVFAAFDALEHCEVLSRCSDGTFSANLPSHLR